MLYSHPAHPSMHARVQFTRSLSRHHRVWTPAVLWLTEDNRIDTIIEGEPYHDWQVAEQAVHRWLLKRGFQPLQ